jgi:hypothetical protein
MEILNTRELKRRGAALAGGFRRETGKLVLVYCGVLALLSMGSSGLNLLLESRIGQTGGLGGLGMRSVLQTVQTILDFVNLFFSPFWSAGFLLAMLAMVRGTAPRVEMLTGGFRRFGRILGGLAFEYLAVIALTIAAVNLGSILFAMTATGRELTAQLEPLMADPNFFTPEGVVNMEMLPVEALTQAALPLAALTGVTLVPMLIWLGYGFRMAMYLMMERPIGGVQAHFESMRLMRGHKWQVLKLDLRYWWYYAMGLAVGVLAYLDQILPLLGISLPLDPNLLYFLAMGLYCLANLALCLWKKCEVDAAHILAYEAIAHPSPVQAEC